VVTLPVSGTYQVEVTSFDPNDTGAYTLTVSPTAAAATAIAPPSSSKVRRTPAAAPDLTVTAASTVAASPPGRTIALNYTVTNGRVALTGFKIGFYLSRDSIFDVNDVQIASRTVTSLAAGGEVRGPTSATIPANTAPGTYRVLVRADSEGVLVEPSEADNVRATGAIVIGPDLTVTAATATASSVARGLTIDIDHSVKNTGAVAGSFTVRFYLSTNDTYSRTSDTLLQLLPTPSSPPATGRTVSSLAAGAVNRATTRLKIPIGTSPGPYRILVRVDAGGSGSAGAIVEASETNNVRATGVITVNP
jgi:trimeric autotransporter adhesin